MKKTLLTVIIGTALVFCCTFFSFAAGSGYVSGSSIIYNFEDVPANDPAAFTVYLFTGDAKIRCFGSSSTKSPQAVNGAAVNKYNMTSPINKGTVVSKGALKTTQQGGTAVKAAERVTFSYTYTGGRFRASVTIEKPASSLTGLAFVCRDRSSHYYALGGGTIDISALVRQAVRNAAGPGGGSGSGSGQSQSSGGGSSKGGSAGGSAGPGEQGSGNDENGSGTVETGAGSPDAGNSGGSAGTGSKGGSGGGNDTEDVTISDHAGDKQDIRDSITEINPPSASSDHNKKDPETDKPPCVLRRIWG